jgi:MFS family permease
MVGETPALTRGPRWQHGGVSRRPLVLLECANVLGGVSNALVMVVVPWLILERTGSAAAAGLAGALTAIPGIVMAPAVGVVIDRVGRRAVSVASDVCSAVSVLLFPLLDLVGVLDLPVILVLTLLGAAFDPAGYTARKALIPDVADAAGVSRDHVNGLHEGLFMAGWAVGPMLGALGIATLGSVATMWLAFGAFTLAAGCVALLRVTDHTSMLAHDDHETTPWRSARAGLAVLVADRPMWLLTLAIAVIVLIYMPTESVLLPVHFEAADQPGAFGAVLSVMAIGAMAGAFGFGWLARRLSRYRIAMVSITVVAVAYVPLAFLPAPAVMVVPALFLGLFWGPMEPLLNSLVQDRFPAHQHGRVYGVQLSVHYAAAPMGQLLAGLAVAGFGVQPVLIAIAGGLVAVAVLVVAMPTLRGLDQPVRDPARPPVPADGTTL